MCVCCAYVSELAQVLLCVLLLQLVLVLELGQLGTDGALLPLELLLLHNALLQLLVCVWVGRCRGEIERWIATDK